MRTTKTKQIDSVEVVSGTLGFKVHTSRLLTEILQNNNMAILRIPLAVLYNLIRQVAKRAAELNDPELNVLMMRLALYSTSDPDDPEYDADFTQQYIDNKKG